MAKRAHKGKNIGEKRSRMKGPSAPCPIAPFSPPVSDRWHWRLGGRIGSIHGSAKNLPTDTGLGFVLIQHLDPLHDSALTQLLRRATQIPVREATHNSRVEPNHVYVIPPNTNLAIAAGVLKLQPRVRGRAPARSIDFFFESLAQDQKERAIGELLRDGNRRHAGT